MSSTLSRFKQMSPQARELLHALRFPPEATEQVYALVDCNNFYASCERAFDPKLKDVPIVVLSSNDGCIVARSNEVKAMGVGMGEPYFKYKEIIEGNNVKVFSSNFTFYGDMSRRVMSTLMQFAPEMEIYSIDEAFLNLAGCDHLRGKPDLTEYAREIAATVRKWTGIPVSVGLAPTKTLGKLANYLAKKKPESGGVMNLLDRSIRDAALESAPVGAIWGVGPTQDGRCRLAAVVRIARFLLFRSGHSPATLTQTDNLVRFVRTAAQIPVGDQRGRGRACGDCRPEVAPAEIGHPDSHRLSVDSIFRSETNRQEPFVQSPASSSYQ